MRCRPSRWLWGLLPLALLGSLLHFAERPSIERDLTQRATQALGAAGLGWATPRLEARDGVVSGAAVSDEDRKKAVDILRQTWGVRIAEDKTALIQAVSPYVWGVARDGSSVKVTGFVANEADRKAVLALAASALPGMSIADQLQVARGTPPRDRWLGGIRFALGQVAGLSRGTARLDDLALTIDGDAATPQTYVSITKALGTALPAGVKLASASVRPPSVDPYAWSAAWDGGKLALDGYVPSEAARKSAIAGFNAGPVSDKTLVASGAPGGFDKVVQAALAQLPKLARGTVKLVGKKVELRGEAVEQDTAEAVMKAMHAGVPAGLASTEAVTWQKARIPVVKPFEWSATLQGQQLKLSGYVPDDKARTVLKALAAQQLRGVTVVDGMAIAAGAPGNWLAAASAGLQQLAKLDQGRVRLTDTLLDITGHAADKATAEGIGGALRAGLPSGFNPSADVKYDAPKVVAAAPEPQKPAKPIEPALPVAKPFNWDAALDNGTVVVSGWVPSEKARAGVLGAVANRMPGVKVIDKMQLGAGAPPEEDWVRSVDAGIDALTQIGGGHAQLSDRQLTVTGATDHAELPDRVTSSLKAALPSGYGSQTRITYTPPPPPPAPPSYVTTLKYDGLSVVLEGQVPNADAKSKLMARLKPLFPDREFTDRLTIAEGAPAGWLDALSTGVGQLAQLDAGQLTLRDRAVYLSGTAESEAAISTAKRTVQSGLPTGYKGNDQLTYVAPPAPDPKLLAKKQDESKYNVSKLIRSSTTLSAPECQAVLNSLVKGRAHFASNKADIGARDQASLNELVRIAQRCPATQVAISGHTDSDGASAYNQRLSERRALAVLNYLVSRGIESTRLKAIGYGETEPVAPNDTPAHKAQNRRIEFEVTPG